MQNSKDFEKYLKSKKISSSYQDFYKRKISNSISDFDRPVDVFAHLLDKRILMLTGEVDDYICDLLKANLLYLESIDSKKDISIFINSGGGSVYSGLGLLDVMDFVKPDIITVNTGLAASMAAVILCSGNKGKRKSLKRSRTMIHQPSGYSGWQQQASEMEIEAKEMNFIKKELYEIISERTGQTYDRVHKDSDRDYWMSAVDAKKYGMIDEVIIKRK